MGRNTTKPRALTGQCGRWVGTRPNHDTFLDVISISMQSLFSPAIFLQIHSISKRKSCKLIFQIQFELMSFVAKTM
jgi:hypothetical protein